MRVLVTGSAGYLGSAVAVALRDAGHDAVGLDVDNQRIGGIPGVDNRYGSVGNPELISPLTYECDAVVHLAALSGKGQCTDNPARATEVNIEATAAITRHCVRDGTPLIFASSVGVYSPDAEPPLRAGKRRDPSSFYMQTKRAAEDLIAAQTAGEIPALVMQMSNLYGVHGVNGHTVGKPTVVNHFTEQARDGDPITVHRPGTQTRDFIHVESAARAYRLAVEAIADWPTGVTTLPLASGRLRTVDEVAQWAADETGVTVLHVEHPDEPTWVQPIDPRPVDNALGWEAVGNIEDYVRRAVHE